MPVPVKNRTVRVVALNIPIIWNRQGDNDPLGHMFALYKNMDKLQADNSSGNNSNDTYTLNKLMRPLVLRCNEGDQLIIEFTNMVRDLSIGIHVSSKLNSVSSDGSSVGRNPSTLAAFQETKIYTWQCQKEGAYYFFDGGSFSYDDKVATTLHGLFGALIVEPRGSLWTDPETGEKIIDGFTADIHPPKPCCFEKNPFKGFEKPLPEKWNSYREHVVIFHSNPNTNIPKSVEPKNPCGTVEEKLKASNFTNGINYRTAHIRNTERKVFEKIEKGDKEFLERPVHGEDQHHSSWFNGDPDTPVFKNYAGDPVKFHVISADDILTHVFHFHVHQWYAVENDTSSPIIDSFTITPQAAVSFMPLYGAGSRLKAIGDAIFHCHIYAHFKSGMWGLFRIFNTLQDSSGTYPDGTQIKRLMILPDREPPPWPTKEKPGFPNFIPGTPGQKSPKVPWPVKTLGPIPEGSDYREATEMEINAMNSDPQPATFFTLNTIPNYLKNVTRNLVAVNRDILFNDYGWHDYQGHLFMIEEEEFGDDKTPRKYEPFVQRINHNTVLVNKLTNKLLANFANTSFDLPLPECDKRPSELECGLHVHFVKFDVLTTDGSSIGWNYISAPKRGKFLLYRWWIDEEFGNIFFHDHVFPVYRQKRGMYGVTIAEAEGSTWFKPDNHSKGAVTGLEAVIFNASESFREVVLFIGDSSPAFSVNGTPVNPPPSVALESGVMTMNYRSEPITERILKFRSTSKGKDPDPADLFSSQTGFGDPATTIFRSYPGDQLVIRLIQGTNIDSHSFNAFGLRWQGQHNRNSFSNQQITGISEQFSFQVDPTYGSGDKAMVSRAVELLWFGCWSILRVHSELNDSLIPLPNNKSPFSESLPKIPTDDSNTRQYQINAINAALDYTKGYQGNSSIDPFAIIYQVTAMKEPGSDIWTNFSINPEEPLVIRAKEGEVITIHLTNKLISNQTTVEPERPAVFADILDYQTISSRVSIHADLVLYDANSSDGGFFGNNNDSTVPLGETKVYTWYADGLLGAVLLQDRADFRNHPHHGLIGALIIEPKDFNITNWIGTEAFHVDGNGSQVHESVLLFQDGLRRFIGGITEGALPNDDPQTLPEDTGQAGINYAAADTKLFLSGKPPTKIFQTFSGMKEKMFLLAANDKSRAFSFTIHGHTFDIGGETVGVVNGIAPGFVKELTFEAGAEGEWAYRVGNVQRLVDKGMWGIFKVLPADANKSSSVMPRQFDRQPTEKWIRF